MKETVANNRHARMNKKDFFAKGKFRKSERPGAKKRRPEALRSQRLRGSLQTVGSHQARKV
jgi:hypothetical protein